MSKYLLIASRDPFEHADVPDFYRVAQDLAQASQEVTLFLVQNGVLSAREGAHGPHLEALRAVGVEILADDFSLRERGISLTRLVPGVKAAPIETVIDQLAEGRKTIWN